jgi:hypothetical protein
VRRARGGRRSSDRLAGPIAIVVNVLAVLSWTAAHKQRQQKDLIFGSDALRV